MMNKLTGTVPISKFDFAAPKRPNEHVTRKDMNGLSGLIEMILLKLEIGRTRTDSRQM